MLSKQTLYLNCFSTEHGDSTRVDTGKLLLLTERLRPGLSEPLQFRTQTSGISTHATYPSPPALPPPPCTHQPQSPGGHLGKGSCPPVLVIDLISVYFAVSLICCVNGILIHLPVAWG